MDAKELIEALSKLSEDAIEGVSEDVLTDVPAEEPEVQPEEVEEIPAEAEPIFSDTMSLADTLDAKTKIARALENLKVSIEEFKDATAEKVDLLKDELLLGGIDGLDEQVKAIEAALASGSNILGNSELNDAFKTELPQEPIENEEEGEAPEETEEEAGEDMEEYNFDDAAGLDLLNPEA